MGAGQSADFAIFASGRDVSDPRKAGRRLYPLVSRKRSSPFVQLPARWVISKTASSNQFTETSSIQCKDQPP